MTILNNSSIQRLSENARRVVCVWPRAGVKTFRAYDHIRIECEGKKYDLSEADGLIWALVHQRKSVEWVEDEALRRLGLGTSYREFVEDVLRSFCQLRVADLVENGAVVTIRSWTACSLRSAHFSLTSRCNLRCVHCLIAPAAGEELSTNEAKCVLDELAELGTEIVNFSGGEVCVRSDFDELLSHSCRLGFSVSMNTNATLVNAARAIRWARMGIKSVAVSVYGSSPLVHDLVTAVPGSFERTMNAISALRDAGMDVVVKTMVLQQNCEDLDGVSEMAARLGCAIVFDGHVLPRQDGVRQPLSKAVDDDLFVSLMASRARPKPRIERWSKSPICSAGQDRIAIGAFGELFPCAVFRMQIGSIRTGSIREQLAASEPLRRFKEASVDDVEICSTCSTNGTCSICPGVAFSETGDYLRMSRRACLNSSLRSFC